MKSFTVEEITQIVGGMLSKAESPEITHIAPPLLSDEKTLALALGEEEIANLAKSKAKAALVPLGVQINGLTTIEVERPRLAMMKLLNLFYVPPVVNRDVPPYSVVGGVPAKVISYRFNLEEIKKHEELLYPIEDRLEWYSIENGYTAYKNSKK